MLVFTLGGLPGRRFCESPLWCFEFEMGGKIAGYIGSESGEVSDFGLFLEPGGRPRFLDVLLELLVAMDCMQISWLKCFPKNNYNYLHNQIYHS